jgi:hypothetical protein
MRMRVKLFKPFLVILSVIACLVAFAILPACSKNPPKTAPTFVDASAKHLHDVDQFVKIVNDISTGAITARKTNVMDQNLEVQILTVNKQILDYIRANPDGTQAKVLEIITNGKQALPANLQEQFATYLQKALDFLNEVK